MAQVISRDEEIKSLKIDNQRLDEIIRKKKVRFFFKNKRKELLDRNEKLAENVLEKLPMQGARHIILDMIIREATKMGPYLNYIKDKEMVINVARQSCTTVK